MSDLNRRNAAALDKLEAAHNEPPEDIMDTPAFEAMQLLMWEERILDTRGYMIEGIMEQSDDALNSLAMMINRNQTGTYTIAIGRAVSDWVTEHCEPSTEDVLEKLNEKPFEDY